MRYCLLCFLTMASCGGPSLEATPIAASEPSTAAEPPSPDEANAAPSPDEARAAQSPGSAEPPEVRPVESPVAAAPETAALPTLAPVPGSLRLVVVHSGELLGSEERQLTRFLRRIGRGRSAERATPVAAESAAAQRWLDGTGHEVPEAWARSETVLALRFGAVQERSGRRISCGVVGAVVLRPGTPTPFYSERASPNPTATHVGCGRPRIDDERWAAFIDSLLDGLPGAS